jgi:soluble lytic murein transglycosylase
MGVALDVLKRAEDLNVQGKFLETFNLLGPISPADEQIPGSPLLTLYYPRPFLEFFKVASRNYKVDVEILLGLARQESAFQENIVTFDFGFGIMQVQAEKAVFVAQERKLDKFHENWLLEASYNIDFGSYVLRESLNHFHGKTYLAVAAYNAGIPVVESWAKNRNRNSVDEFIEDIPFEGTCRHVRNVLKNRANYTLLSLEKLPVEYF